MKKKLHLYVLVVLIITLSFSCASTNPDGSPKWTTKVPTHWRTYYAAGYGKLSNVQNSRLKAVAMAQDEIARWVSLSVTTALTNYSEDTGQSDLQMMELISRQVVDVSLRGVEVEEVYVAQDNGVWVLCSFPIKNLKEAYKEQAAKLQRDAAVDNAQQMIAYLESVLAKEGK